MKKIILLFIIVLAYIVIIYDKTKTMEVGKINLNLKEEETALTIINNENIKALLINDNNFLVISYIDENEIIEILNNCNIEILDNFISLEYIGGNINSFNRHILNKKIEIDNFKIEKEENIIKIKKEEHQFCIYETGYNKNLFDCEFIWFIDIDDIDFDDNKKIVFYDNTITQNKTEKFYDKWVDSYTLDNNSYYSLRLSKENYDIINISVTK